MAILDSSCVLGWKLRSMKRSRFNQRISQAAEQYYFHYTEDSGDRKIKAPIVAETNCCTVGRTSQVLSTRAHSSSSPTRCLCQNRFPRDASFLPINPLTGIHLWSILLPLIWHFGLPAY